MQVWEHPRCCWLPQGPRRQQVGTFYGSAMLVWAKSRQQHQMACGGHSLQNTPLAEWEILSNLVGNVGKNTGFPKLRIPACPLECRLCRHIPSAECHRLVSRRRVSGTPGRLCEGSGVTHCVFPKIPSHTVKFSSLTNAVFFCDLLTFSLV